MLATPLSLKAANGLPHPLSNHPDNESTLWIENRTNWRHNVQEESEAKLLLSLNKKILPEYAETENVCNKAEAIPDYAEVDTSHTLTTFQGCRDGSDEKSSSLACSSEDGSSSPAPYATTTIISGNRSYIGRGMVSSPSRQFPFLRYFPSSFPNFPSSSARPENVRGTPDVDPALKSSNGQIFKRSKVGCTSRRT